MPVQADPARQIATPAETYQPQQPIMLHHYQLLVKHPENEAKEVDTDTEKEEEVMLESPSKSERKSISLNSSKSRYDILDSVD